jgi:excisionase family DNA binding protein
MHQTQPGRPAPTESAREGSRFLIDFYPIGRPGESIDTISVPPTPLGGAIDNIQAAADDANRRFLTAAEAAEFLGGLNSRTVTRWAREGYLPSYPIGEGKRRLWRFLESDLEQWMLSRRTGQISDFHECGHTLLAATDALYRRNSHD